MSMSGFLGCMETTINTFKMFSKLLEYIASFSLGLEYQME